MSQNKLTFEQWMSEVDQIVSNLAGCSVHDLADCPFKNWYNNGLTAAIAANQALENEGWGEGDDDDDYDDYDF